MYSPHVSSGALAVTGFAVLHYTVAGLVLVALGLSLLALIPRKRGDWK